MSRTRSIGNTLSDGLTNADQHPTTMQKLIYVDATQGTTQRFMWPTGVTAALQGNSPHCVVLEVLSIGHTIRFLQITTQNYVIASNDFTIKVRTEPKTQAISQANTDMLYYELGGRHWGRTEADNHLVTYDESNTQHERRYADNGHGVLIAAPALNFFISTAGSQSSANSYWCSFMMTYRYRTIPFHQFRKLYQEQTSRSRLL